MSNPTIPAKLPLPLVEMQDLIERLQTYKQTTEHPDEIDSTIKLIATEMRSGIKRQFDHEQPP